MRMFGFHFYLLQCAFYKSIIIKPKKAETFKNKSRGILKENKVSLKKNTV